MDAATPTRLLAPLVASTLVVALSVGAGPLAIGAVCAPLGGAPGPAASIGSSGIGAIAPDALSIAGQPPGDFVAELVGAAPVPGPLGCAAPGSPDRTVSGEPASLPAPGPGRAAGNPVDLVTGNKYARRVDVEMPDSESGLQSALRVALGADAERALGEAWQAFARLGFVFSRHYNSRFAHAGPLGPGWRHGFETALARLPGPLGIELQIIQADGRRIVFRRDSGVSERVRYASPAPSDGHVDEDRQAMLPWSWRWPDGRVLRFDLQGRLARIEAPDRDHIALHRDAGGRLQRLEDGSGRALGLHYRGERLVALLLPGGARIAYRYDRHGVLESVRYPDGRAVRHHYEDLQAFHLLTGIEAPDGSRSRYRYDASSRVAQSIPARADAAALTFEYRLPERAGDIGETIVREGDRQSVWRWRIDRASGAGALLSSSGPRCSSCPVLAAGDGQPTVAMPGQAPAAGPEPETLRPGRAKAPPPVMAFDASGLPTEARLHGVAAGSDGLAEPIAMHLRWHRHAAGSLAGKLAWVERLSPDGTAARTTFRHDSRRSLVAIEGPEGLVERFERDGLNRATVAHRSDRARQVARFDTAWRLVEWVDRGASHSIRWDGTGRPASIRWPTGERWSLDWAGAGPRIVSDRGWVATGRATPGNRKARAARVALALSDPHPVVVDAAGRQSEFRYDDFGRLVEESSSATGVRRYRHDAWGRVTEIASTGGLLDRRRYDLAGRMVEREQSLAGERVQTRLGWDGALLVAVDHPEQGTRIEYDAWGRPAAIEHTVLGVRHRTTVERDHRQRIVARGLPDGSRLRYRFDRVGRPAAMLFEPAGGGKTTVVVDGMRYRQGRVAGWRYGNGVRLERRNDSAGRPIELRWIGEAPLLGWRYRWRTDGLPAAIADLHGERRYGWDAFGRLIVQERHAVAANAGQPVRTAYFAWDLAGDLRFARRPDGREWTSGETQVARDATGRRRQHGASSLRYGPQQRIVEVSRADRVLARYAYNAAGERVLKRTEAGTTGYLYRGRTLAAEIDGEGRIVRHYLRWQGRPIAVVDLAGAQATLGWLHGDHLGTPHAASDASGRLVWRGDYEAFGQLATEAGTFRQPLRLAGQYHDPETGLHDNYLRSYDPATASYLEPDPLGLAAGLSPWSYADGNPLLATDPLGLILFAFDGTDNGDPAPGRDDVSNVRKFFQHYGDGQAWYMTGVGLDDRDSGIGSNALDSLNANTARARVDYLVGELDAYLDDSRIGESVDVDVVGFSRGAAMARHFVNRVARLDAEHYWWAQGFCVNLRFLGLWDTVAQFGENGSQNKRWQLGIPSAVGAAFHAVALNEHRALFPLEAAQGAAVVERGFIGSHADVGGGNAEGDLSDISLVWMSKMAVQAGVRMRPLAARYTVVESPLIHDRNYDRSGDRRVDLRDASGAIVSRSTQRQASIGGMDWAQSQPFLITHPVPERDAYGRLSIAGTVDLAAYAAWLSDQYGIRVAVR